MSKLASPKRLFIETNKQSRVQSARRKGRPPSIALAVEALGNELPEGRASALRPVARAVCQACEIREGSLPDVAEPAWALLTHAAGETCAACNLASVTAACQGCPLPETLIRLARVTAGVPK